MKEWRFTKVWQVDHKFVIADTICEAVNLYKTCFGKDYTDEPYDIQPMSTNSALSDYDALINVENNYGM